MYIGVHEYMYVSVCSIVVVVVCGCFVACINRNILYIFAVNQEFSKL